MTVLSRIMIPEAVAQADVEQIRDSRAGALIKGWFHTARCISRIRQENYRNGYQ